MSAVTFSAFGDFTRAERNELANKRTRVAKEI